MIVLMCNMRNVRRDRIFIIPIEIFYYENAFLPNYTLLHACADYCAIKPVSFTIVVIHAC